MLPVLSGVVQHPGASSRQSIYYLQYKTKFRDEDAPWCIPTLKVRHYLKTRPKTPPDPLYSCHDLCGFGYEAAPGCSPTLEVRHYLKIHPKTPPDPLYSCHNLCGFGYGAAPGCSPTLEVRHYLKIHPKTPPEPLYSCHNLCGFGYGAAPRCSPLLMISKRKRVCQKIILTQPPAFCRINTQIVKKPHRSADLYVRQSA